MVETRDVDPGGNPRAAQAAIILQSVEAESLLAMPSSNQVEELERRTG
jgi:hypothetical protein